MQIQYSNLNKEHEALSKSYESLESNITALQAKNEKLAADWESKYNDLNEKLTARHQSMNADWETKYAEISTKLEEASAQAKNWKVAHDKLESDWKKKFSDLENSLSKANKENSTLDNSNVKLAEANGKLGDEINYWKGKYKSDNSEWMSAIKTWEKDNAKLRANYDKLFGEIDALKVKLAAAKAKPAPKPVDKKPASKEDAALERVKAKKSKIDFAGFGSATKAEKDDLKLIKGIGPFLEKKLNALDIFTFRQIANFKSKDEDMVNDAIEFFPGRIKRDEWVRQAKGLRDGKPVAFKKKEKAAPKSKKDDLKKVEGIGPKIEGLLNKAGVHTWKKLSETKISLIQKVLDDAGSRYQMHDPTTWPKQAGYAAAGQWDKLEKYQDDLNGGRKE